MGVVGIVPVVGQCFEVHRPAVLAARIHRRRGQPLLQGAGPFAPSGDDDVVANRGVSLRDDNPVLGVGIDTHAVGMGELPEREEFRMDGRVQDWSRSRKRIGRRQAGVVGMHRPRPGHGESGHPNREAYRRQQVAVGVRSGRESLRVQGRDGCRGGRIEDVAQLVVVSEARVGQGRLRQHRLQRGPLRGLARAGAIIEGDLCLEPHAQIARRGSVRVRRAPFCCGDVAVGAVFGGRTLPLPRLVADVPELVPDVRGDPDANLRQPHKGQTAVGDGDCLRRHPTCTDPGRQRGAEAQQHALSVVVDVVLGRRERELLGGLVANAALDNIADAVETFCCSTERHGLRHDRVVGRAGPAQTGRRDRDDDLAPGVVAQVHIDLPRPALGHDV